MATKVSKKSAPVSRRKEFAQKIKTLAESAQAEVLFSEIQDDAGLSDADKEALQTDLQVKVNALEQGQIDDLNAGNAKDKKNAQKIMSREKPEQTDSKGKKIQNTKPLRDPEEGEEEDSFVRREKPLNVPEGCKAETMSVEDAHALETAEHLLDSDERTIVGMRPVKPKSLNIPVTKMTVIRRVMSLALAIMCLFSGISFASEVVSTDEGLIGNSRVRVTKDGHLIPVSNNAVNLGEVGSTFGIGYFNSIVTGGGVSFISTLTTNAVDVANSVWGASNGIVMEGATANAHELTITPADPTADRNATFPDQTGTVQLSGAATALTAGAAVTLTVAPGVRLYTDTITTDNEDQTITFSGAGAAGDEVTIIFTTDTGGSGDEVITFHSTLVRSTGTLTLANAAASRYVVRFMSDGTKWNEISRTAVQAA